MDIFARSGNSTTPVFRDPEISDMVRELGEAPALPVKNPDEDRVHRNNLDWIVESVDAPEPLPPMMQGRVLKAADIARGDMWMMNRRNKKRY